MNDLFECPPIEAIVAKRVYLSLFLSCLVPFEGSWLPLLSFVPFPLFLSFLPLNNDKAELIENFGYTELHVCVTSYVMFFFSIGYNHHTYDVSQTIHHVGKKKEE